MQWKIYDLAKDKNTSDTTTASASQKKNHQNNTIVWMVCSHCSHLDLQQQLVKLFHLILHIQPKILKMCDLQRLETNMQTTNLKKNKPDSKSRIDYSIKMQVHCKMALHLLISHGVSVFQNASVSASHQHLCPLKVGVEELSLEPHERSASLGDWLTSTSGRKKDKTTPLARKRARYLGTKFHDPKTSQIRKSCPKHTQLQKVLAWEVFSQTYQNVKISMFFKYKNSASRHQVIMTRSQLAPGYSEVGAVKDNWLVGATATSEVSSFSIPGFLWSKATARATNPWLIFHWKSWLVHYVILC